MAGAGIARGLIGTALLSGLLACSPPKQGGNGAAPENEVASASAPANVATAVKPPVPSAAQELAAAFTAAFPDGAAVGKGADLLTYAPSKLVPLPGDADRFALLAEGTNEDGCHACTGKLRVTYLRHVGNGFAPVSPPFDAVIEGNGFGGPPDWKLDDKGPVPTLTVSAGYTAQGCTETQTELYRLEPAGVVQDKAATRKSEEGC